MQITASNPNNWVKSWPANLLPLQKPAQAMVKPLVKLPMNFLNFKAPNTWGELGNFIRNNYYSWFNWATVILHTMGSMMPFMSIVPKNVSKSFKKFAENFSRFGIPLVKLHTAIEAAMGKRLFESIARLAPTLIIPILPFFNFQLAYGLSSGVNVVLEHLNPIIGDLSKNDSISTNNQKVIDGFKTMVKTILDPQSAPKDRSKFALALGGAGFMLAGAIPALLFARNSLNSPLAKIFGSIRSIGGLLGDMSIILFSTKESAEDRRKEKMVGSFFLIPSIMDFAQRFIDQGKDANEVFNHAKTALNTIAEVIWSSFSTDRNLKQEQEEDKAIVAKPQLANIEHALHEPLELQIAA
ncbi:MAG: hypothetical protein LW817_05740 [Candidatus Caenarcaniphilales bacterium]|jgi:hypothetical protein|nr:hypothetical protein [Candidatus Caenarcaniphilales bacterium]